MDRLVYAITRSLDPQLEALRDPNDLFFVLVLLLKHFKDCGGLVLPPQRAARVKQFVYEVLSADAVEVQYPNW